jgi:hypothetical protein
MAIPLSAVGSGDGEVGQGEHGESDVAVPDFVAPDLVVVHPDLVFGGLKVLLDRPPGPRDLHQDAQRDRIRRSLLVLRARSRLTALWLRQYGSRLSTPLPGNSTQYGRAVTPLAFGMLTQVPGAGRSARLAADIPGRC